MEKRQPGKIQKGEKRTATGTALRDKRAESKSGEQESGPEREKEEYPVDKLLRAWNRISKGNDALILTERRLAQRTDRATREKLPKETSVSGFMSRLAAYQKAVWSKNPALAQFNADFGSKLKEYKKDIQSKVA